MQTSVQNGAPSASPTALALSLEAPRRVRQLGAGNPAAEFERWAVVFAHDFPSYACCVRHTRDASDQRQHPRRPYSVASCDASVRAT
jgi:hypothetical protein